MHEPLPQQAKCKAISVEGLVRVPFYIANGCHLLQTNPSMVQMAAERMRDMSPEELQEALRQVRQTLVAGRLLNHYILS